MKKIGIVTLTNNNNFGNRLQNYATQEILKKYFDYEIETVINYGPLNNRRTSLLDFLKFLKLKLNVTFKEGTLKRKAKFKQFNTNIKFNKKRFDFRKSREKYFNYEILVVGSDQIWHPVYRMKDFDLGNFGNCSFKFSLSSSLSANIIPSNLNRVKVKDALSKFKGISVREDRGKSMLEEITGRQDIEVLIDPTMMLTKEEWDKVTKVPSYHCEGKYILVCFLGKRTQHIDNFIQDLVEKNNYNVIDIFKNWRIYNKTGPSEFLYLIQNAEVILTDSFHACTFSIIFNRPFIVFNRLENRKNQMNSRIETLLKKFKLESRMFNENNKNILSINYDKANKILEIERKKVNNYLTKMQEKYKNIKIKGEC